VLQVARQTVETRQLLADRVSLMASNGLKTDLDVSFAKVDLEEGRLLLEKAQNDTDASQAALSTALGLRETKPFSLADETGSPTVAANNVSDLIDLALQDRPELSALRDERDAALRYARSQQESRLPTLSAVGTAGAATLEDSRLPDRSAAAGLQLTMPLFAGGLYLARQHEYELRAKNTAELLRAAENNVIRDVRIAWLNMNNARQRLQTTAQLVTHATDAFALAQSRFGAGSSSIIELSQAQLELISAQIANLSARYDVLIQSANLRYQTGTLQSVNGQ